MISANHMSGVQVIFLKFLLSALASAVLAYVIALLMIDDSVPSMVLSAIAVSWIGLAKHSIEEAYKLGRSA